MPSTVTSPGHGGTGSARFGASMTIASEAMTRPPARENRAGRRLHCQVDVRAGPDESCDLWLRLEELPRILDGVRRVKRVGDRRMLWEVDVAGRQLVWEAELTALDPGRRIAWESRWGAAHAGQMRFERVADDRTRVEVDIRYWPHGWVERLGAWLGLVRRQVEVELALFRRFVEKRAREARRAREESRSPEDCAIQAWR